MRTVCFDIIDTETHLISWEKVIVKYFGGGLEVLFTNLVANISYQSWKSNNLVCVWAYKHRGSNATQAWRSRDKLEQCSSQI